MMKKVVTLVCAFLMVVLVLGSCVQATSVRDKTSPNGVLVPVDAPVWKVGDSWSMGVKVDIGDLAGPYISEMKNLTKNSSSQIKSFDANAEGYWAFYEIYKITDVTSDSYRMSIEIVQGMHLTCSMSEIGKMPKEGTWTHISYIDMNHSYNYSDMYETEERTITASVGADYEFITTGYAFFDKATIAVKNINLSATTDENIWFEAKGFPDYTYSPMSDYHSEMLPNGTEKITYTMNMYYTDYDISITANCGTDCLVTYSPKLDIFRFPISVGKVWPVISNMTISGKYWGNIKQTGMPQTMLSSLAGSGITFPIDLKDSKYNRGPYQNGVIKPETAPIDFTLQCTGTKDVLLPDNTVTTCYVIEQYIPPSPPYGYFDTYSLDGTWIDGNYNIYNNYTIPVGFINEEYPISDYRVALIDGMNYSTIASIDPLSTTTQHWTSPGGAQSSLTFVDSNSDGILNVGDNFKITNLQQSAGYTLDVFFKPTDSYTMASSISLMEKVPTIFSNGYPVEPSSQAVPWFGPASSSGSAQKQFYSKDKGFIVSGEVTVPDVVYGYSSGTGGQTFTLKPLSEGDARNGIDSVKLSPSKSLAISSLMIMALSAVIAVIIIVYLIIFISHRKRKTAQAGAVTSEKQPTYLYPSQYQPVAQPYQQPQYPQQYPEQYPQQYPPSPPPQY